MATISRLAAIAVGVKIAEGQRFGFHNLRHSLATFLVTKAKADPKTVQALLRHANARTTLQLYTQSMPDDRLSAQAQILEAIFQQQPGTVQ
jgi:integrase